MPLGFGRVYVHQPEGFSYESWIEGLDAGRSFVTTGPMIDVKVNGSHGMGSTLHLPTEEKLTVEVTASWPRHLALKHVELVVNGRAVRLTPKIEQDHNHYSATTRTEVAVKGTMWIAARVFTHTAESWRTRAVGSAVRFAHSSPIWIEVPDKPIRPSREGIAWLVQRMNDEISRNTGVLTDEAIDEYREGLRTYQKIQAELD